MLQDLQKCMLKNTLKSSYKMITKNTELKEILELGKECSQCGHCCKYGSGFLADDDLKNIAEHLKMKKEDVKEKYLEEVTLFNTARLRPKTVKKGKPYGKCVFYDEKCTIHEVKPLQCRTGNGCNGFSEDLDAWFKLNFFVNSDDPKSLKEWNIYLESGGHTIDGGKIEDLKEEKNGKKS